MPTQERPPRLHVVTGIPGTRIRKSLGRFKDLFPHVEDVSLEEKLWPLAQPYVADLFPLLARSPLGVFLLPRGLLERLWLQAFKDAWATVTRLLDDPEDGKDVLLTLHLCYFHHGTREYLTVTDFTALKEAFSDRAAAVVTLIDDVYDCLQQLSGPNQAFDPPQDFGSAALDALQTLDWRSVEILLSDWLARSCHLHHHLFAVKHPIHTFHDLLYADKPSIYLSHPISEPRRMWEDQNHSALQEILKEIEQVLDRLRRKFVVFEPATIDEYRFLQKGRSPKLGSRWPFRPDTRELLYVQPDVPRSDFTFPVAWQEDHRAQIPDSPILGKLKQAINNQIDSRDHALVEKAERVVCYRPLYQGNASGGVQEELNHQARLMRFRLRASTHTAFVYSPREDRDQYPIRQLWEEAVAEWQDNAVVEGAPDDFHRLREDLRLGTAPERDAVLQGDGSALTRMLHRHRLLASPIKTSLPKGALGTTDEVRRQARAKELAESVRGFHQNYLDKLLADHAIKLWEDKGEFFAVFGR